VKYARPLGIGAAAALFVLIIVTLMLGATSQDQGMNMPGMDHPSTEMAGMDMSGMDMTNPLAGLEGEAFEVGFMSMMIAHHQSATEMAQWILERTENPEITEAAQTIIDEQEAEIAQMTGWLQEWYGQEPDAEMMGMMNEMMGGMMQSMMDSVDPDRAFLEGMSEHHDGAIDMAQLALFQSTHEQLRGLAEKIIRDQAAEISQFQAWLAER
jgi:uncharacterized protein (DUF305 family)